MKTPHGKNPATAALVKITNTAGRHPGPTVDGLPVGLTVGPAAILVQEVQGTREVARAAGALLPMEGTTTAREQLNCTRAGIKLGTPVTGDPLFRHAELPAGWRTAPSSEDSRTTDILDGKGNRRGSIWYKAASYDRKATMHLRCRYDVVPHYFDMDGARWMTFVVEDRAKDRALWTGAALARPGDRATAKEWQEYEAAGQESWHAALGWLAANYPNHDDVGAYWET